MQSWGADFGYQTVDQDWKLEYPPLDGRLAQIERQAVEEARDRLKWLAQMNPGRYGADGERHGSGGSRGKAVYHVSPLGGLVREGRPTLRAASPGRFGGERTARSGTGSSDGRNGADWAAAGDTKRAQEKRANREQQPALADEFGSRARKGPNNHTVGPHRSNDKVSNPRYGDLNDRAGSRDSLISGTEMSAQGSAQTDPDTGQTEVQMQVAQRQKEKPRSLAEMRGSNWGLSPAARASNPITRPIHIVCEGDKLLVQPGRPGDSPAIVPLAHRTEDSVDQLVAELQERIEAWGIAGRGLYWRPQLILEVGHSGEGRYSDLEALLADSGFDVKRK
jgi:hypothetical protein